MKDMDGDYVDQPARSNWSVMQKGVFNFQARTEDQIKGSSSGLEVSTRVVQHANVDVLNGMEGVGPQEIKGLDSNTSLPNSAQQHGKWKRLDLTQRKNDTMDIEVEFLIKKRKVDKERVMEVDKENIVKKKQKLELETKALGKLLAQHLGSAVAAEQYCQVQ